VVSPLCSFIAGAERRLQGDEPMDSSALAAMLVDARRSGVPIARLPPAVRPQDLGQAYATAEKVAAILGPVVGWKLGATSARAMQFLGVEEPFYGPVFAGTVLDSPATWGASRPVTVDAELVFVMAAEPASAAPEAVKAATGAVRIGLEINAPRLQHPFEEGALAIIADTGANAGLVLGPALDRARWSSLGSVEVTMRAGGTQVAGKGDGVMGDPWNALAFLVAALARNGRTLAAGSVVASGNIAFVEAPPGSAVTADFGPDGSVSLLIA